MGVWNSECPRQSFKGSKRVVQRTRTLISWGTSRKRLLGRGWWVDITSESNPLGSFNVVYVWASSLYNSISPSPSASCTHLRVSSCEKGSPPWPRFPGESVPRTSKHSNATTRLQTSSFPVSLHHPDEAAATITTSQAVGSWLLDRVRLSRGVYPPGWTDAWLMLSDNLHTYFQSLVVEDQRCTNESWYSTCRHG